MKTKLFTTLLLTLIFSSAAFADGKPSKAQIKAEAEHNSCVAKGGALAATPAGIKITRPNNVCCANLKEAVSKSACGKTDAGYAGVCLACGDGVCDKYENACNCPQDCAPKAADKVKK